MTFPKNWPIYYGKLVTLGSADSTVGIATLWTKKDIFVNKLDKNSYHAIGQLYSKLGINFMLRNMFAFPKIRNLVVCGTELSDSGKELLKIWETGESEFLDKEIPKEAIDHIRTNVRLVNMIGVNEPSKIEEFIKTLDQKEAMFGDPQTFPEAEQTGPDQYPSDVSGFKVKGKKIVDVWAKLMSTIMKFGEKKNTDEYNIRECLNTVAIIEDEDPDNHYIPDWFIFKEDEIQAYVEKFQDGEFNPNQSYTYGNRMRQFFGIDQIQWIKDRLHDDPNAREAVASLIDPKHDLNFDASRPCVTFVQAIRQREKIHLNVYVRSHDMYAGWPQNAFGFLHLQQEICDHLGAQRGVLTIMSASAHIYDYDWDNAKKIGEDHFQKKMPCEVDPYGNFIIEIDNQNNKIVCHHQSPTGLPVQKFEGQRAEEIIMAITRAQAISIPQHAMDLGRQLYKAEIALAHGAEFVQDRPLKLGILNEDNPYYKGIH